MEGTKLTNLQSELLKVFSFDLPEDQLKEIKTMLARYFADKATTEMDKLCQDENWDQNTIDQWAREHMRTRYE